MPVFKQEDVYSSLVRYEQEYLDSVLSTIETFNSKVSDPDVNLFITIAYDRTYKQFWNAIMFVNTGANISSPTFSDFFGPYSAKWKLHYGHGWCKLLARYDYSKLFRYVVLSTFKPRSQEAFNALKIVTAN